MLNSFRISDVVCSKDLHVLPFPTADTMTDPEVKVRSNCATRGDSCNADARKVDHADSDQVSKHCDDHSVVSFRRVWKSTQQKQTTLLNANFDLAQIRRPTEPQPSSLILSNNGEGSLTTTPKSEAKTKIKVKSFLKVQEHDNQSRVDRQLDGDGSGDSARGESPRTESTLGTGQEDAARRQRRGLWKVEECNHEQPLQPSEANFGEDSNRPGTSGVQRTDQGRSSTGNQRADDSSSEEEIILRKTSRGDIFRCGQQLSSVPQQAASRKQQA